MLIIIALLVLHITIWYSSKKSKFYLVNSVLVLLLSLLWLFLFDIEASSISMDRTYGSDERLYWVYMNSIKDNIPIMSLPAPLYNWWGSLIIKYPDINSIILVRITNVILYSISTSTIYLLLEKKIEKAQLSVYINRKTLQFTFLLFSLNGINIWTAIRNLKEMFFVFNIIIYIYILSNIYYWDNNKFNKKKNYIQIVIISSAFFLIFNNLRPFGGFFIFPIIIGVLLSRDNIIKSTNDFKGNNKLIIKFLGIIIVALIAQLLFNHDTRDLKLLFAFRDLMYTPMSNDVFGISKLITFPVEFVRFILGPGPLNSFKQLIYGDVFVVSTFIGDILIFLGSVSWWFILLASTIKAVMYKKFFIKTCKLSLEFVAITLTIILIYTYVYGGTGDTRLRAMMYIFSSGVLPMLLAGNFHLKKSKKKDIRHGGK